jgi:hypothetical protein
VLPGSAAERVRAEPAGSRRAGEAADMLGTSYGAVASALKHARTTMTRHSPSAGQPPPPPHSAAERTLIDKLNPARLSHAARSPIRKRESPGQPTRDDLSQDHVPHWPGCCSLQAGLPG